ncbi:DUF3848 domain-containing protein [Atopococcus tabaci]|uniref:DUF3848 domain-containing protein n=1 Tax=Atopococcus tabaci TaxID=269774 RepID=UPI0003FA8D13|nr:DUF3848 domain-containing protein [Atopococcus tabaci]
MYRQLMEKVYDEYKEFKARELCKPPHEIFADAFMIAEYENILFHYETTLLEKDRNALNNICHAALITPNLLQKTYEYAIGGIRPLMDEEDFKLFLEEELSK